MTDHLKNATQILDSYESNENLDSDNLLHSATYALIAIAEQFEKNNLQEALASLYKSWKNEFETDMNFGEWLVYGWRLDEEDSHD